MELCIQRVSLVENSSVAECWARNSGSNPGYEDEFLTLIVGHTASTSLRLRMYVEQGDQVPE